MPIERHPMPLVTQERDARYYTLSGRIPRDPQERYGTVRVHRTGCDFFRNRVTVPEVDPSHRGGVSKTFNRGSLIAHLNEEIRRGHVTPGTRRLTYGYCGGWIGGSSDRRIREVYNAVFSYYAAIETMNELSLAHERRIERKDLMRPCLHKGEAAREGARLIKRPVADEKTYFDGAVTVRLYRQGDFTPMRRTGDRQEPVTKAHCILEIITRDQEIDGQALIDAIAGDTFRGALHPIALVEIVVRPQIFVVGGEGHFNIPHEVADALIRSFQMLRDQDELATPKKLYGMNRTPVEGNEVIAENSPLFLSHYPLKESHVDVGGIEGVELHVHRIVQGAQYSVPEKEDKARDNRFLLRIVIRNNEVDILALMKHVEAMTFQNLRKGSWIVGVITVALDPAVFPDPQARLERRQEIIGQIRAWQPISSEGIVAKRRAEEIAERKALMERRIQERRAAAAQDSSDEDLR